MSPNQTALALWRDELVSSFNISELKFLCLDLNIDHETLSGSNKLDMAQEIILHCNRRQRLPEFFRRCLELRPNISWPRIPTDSDESIEQILPTQPKTPASTSDTAPIEKGTAEHIEQEKRLSDGLEGISVSEPPSNWKRKNALTENAALAEKDGEHESAAEIYAELAELLKQERLYVQAREIARMSAGYFLETNRKVAAIEQYLFAAEIWMNHTAFATTMANHDLEEAKKIASEIGNFT